MAASISASETATTRSTPSRMIASASASGTRTETPSATVSQELVETGRPASKERA